MFTCSAKGAILSESEGVASLFGYESLVGMDVSQLVPECMRGHHQCYMERWDNSRARSRVLGHDRLLQFVHREGHNVPTMAVIAFDSETSTLGVTLQETGDILKNPTALMYMSFPKSVAERISTGTMDDSITLHENVTVVLCDVANYTSFCERNSPMQVARFMRGMYKTFDSVVVGFSDVVKIETVGDAYMCAVGLWQPDSPETHSNSARVGIELAIILRTMGTCYLEEAAKTEEFAFDEEGKKVGLRFGVHSGAVASGVFETVMPRFHIYGDVVNTTARLQAASDSNDVMVSTTCLDFAGADNFEFAPIRPMVAKGKKRPIFSTLAISTSDAWMNNPPQHSPSLPSLSTVPTVLRGGSWGHGLFLTKKTKRTRLQVSVDFPRVPYDGPPAPRHCSAIFWEEEGECAVLAHEV